MRPIWAVVTAAGSGTRLGCGGPKALVQVAGRAMLSRALDIFLADPQVQRICVTAPANWVSRFQELAGPQVQVVAGGIYRQSSVRAGIACVSQDELWPTGGTGESGFAGGAGDASGNSVSGVQQEVSGDPILLIHDAARPFTPAAVLRRVVSQLEAGAQAVIPAVAVTDTIRQVSPGSESGTDSTVEPGAEQAGALVDRAQLRAMQTPQGFDAGFIRRAYRQVGDVSTFTDDGAIAQAVGAKLVLVRGDSLSFKITVPLDLRLAEAVAASRVAPGTCVTKDLDK